MKRKYTVAIFGVLLLFMLGGCTDSANLASAPPVDIYANGGGRYENAERLKEPQDGVVNSPWSKMIDSSWANVNSWSVYGDEKSIREVTSGETGPLQGRPAVAGALRNALNASLFKLQKAEESYPPFLVINDDGSKAILSMYNKDTSGTEVCYKLNELVFGPRYIIVSEEKIGGVITERETAASDQLKAKCSEQRLRELLSVPKDWVMVTASRQVDILNGDSGPLVGRSEASQALSTAWFAARLSQEVPGKNLVSVMWHNKDGSEFMISTATWLKAETDTGNKVSYVVAKRQTLALD